MRASLLHVAIFAIFAIAALGLAWIITPRAHAGARAVEVMMVDMNPSPDAESRACVAALVRPLRAAGGDEARVRRVSREILLRRTSAPEDVDLGAAPDEVFQGLRGLDLDAWLLVDCRPDEARIDARVFAGTGREDLARDGHAVHISLRGAALERSVLAGLAAQVEQAVWIGFSP